MLAFLYGSFALAMTIFALSLTAIIRCHMLGVDPKDFMPEEIDLFFTAKLSGCVTIVWLAAIYALHTGHITVPSLG